MDDNISMSNEIKARLTEMTRKQIALINGADLERIEQLRNARAVLCTLKGQDSAVNFIGAELARLGAE